MTSLPGVAAENLLVELLLLLCSVMPGALGGLQRVYMPTLWVSAISFIQLMAWWSGPLLSLSGITSFLTRLSYGPQPIPPHLHVLTSIPL